MLRGRLGPKLHDLNHCNNQVQAVDNVFDGWITDGYWTEALESFDAGTDGFDWSDADREGGWGLDHSTNVGVDDADVGYFSGHGGSDDDCSSSYPWSWITMGDQGGGDQDECRPMSDNSNNDAEWMWGDTDLEIVLLDACQTMQHCVFQSAGYNNVNGTNLQMIAGYHGNSFDLAGQVDAVETYASTSRTSGVGDNWLDERHIDYPLVGTDQCPTVMIWGATSTDRSDFYNNGGLDDRFDTGTPSAATYFFITNCDPQEGQKL